MARSGIRYEDVEQAADEMARAHINPTHERIRHALGGGSFSTIGRHLQTWRQCQSEDAAAVQDAVPPDSLVDAVKGVWQGMRGAAEARVADVEALAKQAIEAAQSAAQAQVDAMTQAHLDAVYVLEAQAQEQATQSQAQQAIAQQRIEDAQAHADVQAQAHHALAAQLTEAREQAAEALGRLAVLAQRCDALEAQGVRMQKAHTQSLIEAEARASSHIAQLQDAHAQALAALAEERSQAQTAYTRVTEGLEAQLQKAYAQEALWQDKAQAAEAAGQKVQASLSAQRIAAQTEQARLQAQLELAQATMQSHIESAQKHEAALYTLRGETQGRVHVIEELREAFNALAGERLVARRPDD